MRWNEIKNEPCSIARTLSVIGDRWTMLILRNAFMGVRRFDDFQQQLDVTRHLLTDRLNLLVENDIFEKKPYQTQPTRYEYRLTPKGKELYPILMTMVQWGDKWMADEDGVPLEYFDKVSGEKLSPVLVDQNSGQPIDLHQVQVKPGKGLIKALKVPEFRERWGALIKKRT